MAEKRFSSNIEIIEVVNSYIE